jgi:hypothetical protein
LTETQSLSPAEKAKPRLQINRHPDRHHPYGSIIACSVSVGPASQSAWFSLIRRARFADPSHQAALNIN